MKTKDRTIKIKVARKIKQSFLTGLVLLLLSFSCFAGDPIQCKAITAKGTQCKRQAVNGSDYCYQHQTTKAKIDTLTGPKGGKYYIKNGIKHYVKK
jgi:hypothetical protein